MADLRQRMEDEWMSLARRSFDGPEFGIAANICQEAMDELERFTSSLLTMTAKWHMEVRQLEESALQEDISDEEACLNKYCAEQLRRCIAEVDEVIFPLRPVKCTPDISF